MVLKWGVLGAGSVAQRRAMPAIKLAQNAELHALFSRSEEKAKRLAEEHGATRYYTRIDRFLEDPELDAVYISSPVYLHCEHLLLVAERGLDILCEKPMAMNVAECQQMISACEQNNVHLQLCFLFRFHSRFQQIKQLISQGQLGDIVEARMPLLKSLSLPEDAWRRNPNLGGGGSLMDLGAHNIDILRYLIGSEIIEVTAFSSNHLAHYEVEETGIVLMKLENGAFAIAETSFMVPKCEIIFEVYGTKGSVLVYDDQGWKIKSFLSGETKVESLQFENFYKTQFEHFARCLAQEEEPITTGLDGLKNIQALSAAYASARTGQTISLKKELF